MASKTAKTTKQDHAANLASFNVKIRITNVDGLSHVVNVPTVSFSANHAKGTAQYETQMKNPGCQTVVTDCYRVVPGTIQPVE